MDPDEQPDPNQPFTYAQILAAHQQARQQEPEIVPEDLPTFSQHLNALTGTQDYNAGLVDNPVRRAVSGYADLTGLVTKPVGEAIGGAINQAAGVTDPAWQKVAPQVTKGALDFIPDLAISKLVETGARKLDVPIPAPVTLSAISGLRTYGETGSIPQSVGTALTTGASFLAGGFAREGALRALGAPSLKALAESGAGTDAAKMAAEAMGKVAAGEGQDAADIIGKQLVPATIKQWLLTHGASVGGMVGTQQVGDYLERLITGARSPTAPELVTSLAGQLPFSLYEAGRYGRRPASQEAKAIIEQSKANTKKIWDDVYKATGHDPSPDDINAAYNRVLRRASLDPTTTLASIKNEAEIDPEFAEQLVSEKTRVEREAQDRQADMDLTVALTGKSVDVTKLSPREQEIYGQLSMAKRPLTTDEQEQLKNLTEVATVTGPPNPETLKRIAAVSGSPAERGTDPNKRNLLERFQGLQWLKQYDAQKARENEEGDPDQAASVLRQTIAQRQAGVAPAEKPGELSLTEPSSEEDYQRDLAAAEGRKVSSAQKASVLRQIVDLEDQGRHDETEELYNQLDAMDNEDTSSPTGYMSKYQQLLPQQSKAAQRAAIRFNPKSLTNRKDPESPNVDWTNPKEVAAFERYIYKAMSNAKLDYERSRAGEETVSDHDTRDEALLNARVLNQTTDKNEGISYGVPKSPNNKGRYVVKKYKNNRTVQLIEEWKQDIQSGGKLDFEDYLKELESGTLYQGPVQADDIFKNHVQRLNEVQHPAMKDALYTSLVKNVISAMRNLSPEEITKITGVKKQSGAAGSNIIGRRLIRWMQFLEEGGKIGLTIDHEPEQEVLGVYDNEKEAQDFLNNVFKNKKGATIVTHPLEDNGPSEAPINQQGFKESQQATQGTVDLGNAFAIVVPKVGGGKVKTIRSAKQDVAEGQLSDLEKLNTYLGDLGYSQSQDLNKRRDSKLNFFEQMNALGRAVGAKFQNPSDLFTRPPGEFGFDVGVIEGKAGKVAIYGSNAYTPAKGKHNFVYQTRDGSLKTFTHDGGIHQILGLMAELKRNQGTIEASVLGDLVRSMDDRDVSPDLKEAIRVLTKTEGAQKVQIGIGMAKNNYGAFDPTSRGWYNFMQETLQGGGALISPFYTDPFTGRVNWLKPQQLAAVIVHELVHANTSIALWKDPAFRAEVKVLHDYIREQYQLKKSLNELVGVTFPSLLGLDEDTVEAGRARGQRPDQMTHGVDEFFAEMWMNPELRKFVWSLPDYPQALGPMPERTVKQLSMFHRFWDTVKRWMQKNFGIEATSLGERVQMMQERAMMTQMGLGQLHDPKYDIYDTLSKVIYQPNDLIVTTPTLKPGRGEPIGKVLGGREEGNFILPDKEAGKPMAEVDKQPNFGLPVGTSGQPKELFFENGKEVPATEKMDEQKQLPEVQEPASTTLASTAPLDVNRIKQALKYGASDWFDDVDGSWNFRPKNGGSFLGWWGLTPGVDYKDNGERISLLPKGQQALTEVLSHESMKANATNTFQEMPQFASGFATIESVYTKAGFDKVNAQRMATLMTRYLMAWKQPDQFLLGDLPLGTRAGGLAYRGGTKMGGENTAGLNTGLLAITKNTAAYMTDYVKHVVLHETFHLADYLSDLTDMASSLKPEERADIMKVVDELTDNKNPANTIPSTDKPVEWSADFASKMVGSLWKAANPSALLKEYLDYTNEGIRAVLSDQFKTQNETVTEFMNALGQGKPVYKAMGAIAMKFTRDLMRPVAESEAMATRALQMRWLYPDQYISAVLETNKKIEQQATPALPLQSAAADPTVLHSTVPGGQVIKEVLGLLPNEKLSWWNKNITRFHMIAQQYPQLRGAWNAVDVASRMAHEASVKVRSILIGSTTASNVDPKGIRKDIQTFVKSDRLQESFSKAVLDMQIVGDKGVNMDPYKIMNLVGKYATDTEDKRILNHVIQAVLEQNRVIGNTISKGHRTTTELVVAIATRKMLEGAMTPEQARRFSSVMFKSFDSAISGRTADHDLYVQQMQQMLPNNKALLDLMNMGQDLYAHYDEDGNLDGGLMYERQNLDKKGGYWMTERRFGDYGIYYRAPDNKITSQWFQDVKTRDEFAKGKQDIRLVDRDTDNGNLGLSQTLIAQLTEMDARVRQRLIETIGQDAFDQSGLNVDMAGELRTAIQAQDLSNTSIRRHHKPGRELLSMYDNQQIYHSGAINAVKNRQMKLEMALALSDPAFDVQPDLKKVAQQHLSNVLYPDTEWGRRIQTANFAYFLMGSIGNMVLEPFQQLMSLAPSLTENGDGIVQGYKRLAKANIDALAHRIGKKSYVDVGLTAAVEKARLEGVIDHGLLAELDYHPDLNYVNSLRAINGVREYGLFDMLKNKAYVAANMGRQFYALMPAHNSEVAFVSAYRQEFEKSHNAQVAYEKAAFVTRNTMFGGGKIGRPVGMFTPTSWGRTASQALYSLQSYNTSMMTLMGYYAKKSFSPKGLSSAQTTQVRKAAVQMWGTQFALAGALGMPFVAGGLAALSQAYPGIEWEQTFRDFLTGWIPDDNALGGFVRDFVAKGLPSATQYGPDMGSRFALGGTLGVSPYNGIGTEYLFGPTASLATNFFQAGQKALSGDLPKAAEQMLPSGLQRLIDAVTQGREFRNKKDQLILDDMNPAERASRALGFTPNRAANVADAKQLAQRATTARNARLEHKVDKWAELWSDGKVDQVRREILDEEVKSQGQEKARDLIQQVARVVESKTMLQDPRELGSRGTAASTDRLLHLMQQGGQTVPTEVERLQKRDDVQTSLGLPSSMTRERVGRSSAIDRLMEMNPALSRATAALAMEHLNRQSTYLEPNYGQQATGE